MAHRRDGGAVDPPHLAGLGAVPALRLRDGVDPAGHAGRDGRHARPAGRAPDTGHHVLTHGPTLDSAGEQRNGTDRRNVVRPRCRSWNRVRVARRGQPAAAFRASPRSLASSADISTTRRPPPSSGTRITMPRPSLVTSRGPSPVRGFIAAISCSLRHLLQGAAAPGRARGGTLEPSFLIGPSGGEPARSTRGVVHTAESPGHRAGSPTGASRGGPPAALDV